MNVANGVDGVKSRVASRVDTRDLSQTFLALLAIMMLTPTALAADGDFVWARSMGGTSYESGRGVAVDSAGNAYTVGGFQGTIDIDPGPGILNLTSAGSDDIFVQKLDGAGELVWAKSIGGPGSGVGLAVAVDGDGNVYLTGQFTQTVDFDPGPGVFNLTSNGTQGDIYVLKLDIAGNLLWARSMGSPDGDWGQAIAVDTDGNVYTTGFFGGTVDFDPGPGTVQLAAVGGPDIFVQKLNSNGELVWARSAGGPGADYGNGIDVDSNGNVLLTGLFRNTVDFDPGPGTLNLTATSSVDSYIWKLDSSGNLAWAHRLDADIGQEIATDAAGNVYTTGIFNDTVDFDPGPGTYNLGSPGAREIFVEKLAADGSFIWARALGGASFGTSYGLALDSAENVYLTGSFFDSGDFDPGPGTHLLNGNGDYDIFVEKLDSSGNFVWAKAIGGTTYDESYAIAVDGSGNVLTTGYFALTADFDPGAGTSELTSAGGNDIFVLKLSGPDLEPPSVTTITPALTGPVNTAAVDFTITFNEDVQNFDDASDLLITHTGTAHTGASITGSGDTYTVTLTGLSGQGTFTLAVSTASDVQDVAGNLLASSVNSAAVAIDTVDPSFSNLSVAPATASAGQSVTLTFTSSEDLASDPDVTINGNAATRAAKAAFTYEYTILPTDPLGPAVIEISGIDSAGNIGVLSDNSALTITAPAQPMPVSAWPLAVVLVLSGALLGLCGGHRGEIRTLHNAARK